MLNSFNRRVRGSAILAAPLFALLVTAAPARAELVTTDKIIDKATVDSRRAEISAILAREDAREQLAAMGIAPDEAAERVAGMSDAEVLQVAQQMDQIPAGQGRGGVSVVVLLLLIILLILVV